MFRKFLRALFGVALLVAPSGAEILTVPCQTPDPVLPDGWVIEGKMVAWNADGVYAQAFVKGNCRIEEEEVCTPGPGDQPVCRTVRKRVCDEEERYYPFGGAVTVVQEKWVYHVRDEGGPVLFGQAFKTFPYWWIVLHHGADLQLSVEEGCFLRLDTETLGFGAMRVESFESLYRVVP